jgi:hypothetical protein
MPSWKKVLVSGSSAEITNITASVVPTGTSENVVLVDSSGRFKQISQGSLSAALGQYAFTGSADSGTNAGINSGDVFRVSGGGGITTTFAKSGTTGSVTVNVNSGSMAAYFRQDAYSNISGDITINSSGVSAIGSSKVTSTMIVNGTITGTDIASNTVANSNLVNSTISGVALGSNLNTLTLGSGLTGTSYNGSAAVSATVDSGSMLPFYSSSIFAKVSGDILITAAGVATIQAGAVAISTDVSGLGTGVATALGTAVGSAGSFVVNGGVLGTPSSATLTNATGLPISTGVSGLGTGVATALGTNIGSVGSVVLNGGALGTPSSATLTNATGLPISTGVSGLGTGIATFLATPSSANLASAVTDETGTGALVFAGSPTFTGTANFANIGASGNLTVTGNTTVSGNLTVSGTASFQNTQNLLIADKFVLLASGSSTLTDGGIIVAYNTAGSGSALFLESGTAGNTGTYGRFAVNYDVASGVSVVPADEFVVTAKTAAGVPSGNPTWGGAANGFGNIYINSSTQDIFIYS